MFKLNREFVELFGVIIFAEACIQLPRKDTMIYTLPLIQWYFLQVHWFSLFIFRKVIVQINALWLYLEGKTRFMWLDQSFFRIFLFVLVFAKRILIQHLAISQTHKIFIEITTKIKKRKLIQFWCEKLIFYKKKRENKSR